MGSKQKQNLPSISKLSCDSPDADDSRSECDMSDDEEYVSP